MSGHLRKRGANTWQLIVFNGYDSSGRRQYSRKTFHGTKKEAEFKLAAYGPVHRSGRSTGPCASRWPGRSAAVM